MNEAFEPRHIGRSVLAVFAGILVGAAFLLGADEIPHLARVYPPCGERMSDPLFGLATAHRIVFSVLGSNVIARLAPRLPMLHARIGSKSPTLTNRGWGTRKTEIARKDTELFSRRRAQDSPSL
jgi:hypothetical protein